MLQSRIRRGELDKEVSFIKKRIVASQSNEDKQQGWQFIDTDFKVWARVKQLPANDVMIADRLTNVMRTELIIDYRTDLNTQMRFVYKAKPYEIISITEDEMSRGVYLRVIGEIVDTEDFSILFTDDGDELQTDDGETLLMDGD